MQTERCITDSLRCLSPLHIWYHDDVNMKSKASLRGGHRTGCCLNQWISLGFCFFFFLFSFLLVMFTYLCVSFRVGIKRSDFNQIIMCTIRWRIIIIQMPRSVSLVIITGQKTFFSQWSNPPLESGIWGIFLCRLHVSSVCACGFPCRSKYRREGVCPVRKEGSTTG